MYNSKVNSLNILKNAFSLLISEFDINKDNLCIPLLKQIRDDYNVKIVCGIDPSDNYTELLNDELQDLLFPDITIRDFINFVENYVRLEC